MLVAVVIAVLLASVPGAESLDCCPHSARCSEFYCLDHADTLFCSENPDCPNCPTSGFPSTCWPVADICHLEECRANANHYFCGVFPACPNCSPVGTYVTPDPGCCDPWRRCWDNSCWGHWACREDDFCASSPSCPNCIGKPWCFWPSMICQDISCMQNANADFCNAQPACSNC